MKIFSILGFAYSLSVLAVPKLADTAYLQIFGLPEKEARLFIEGVEIPSKDLKFLKAEDGSTYINIQLKKLEPNVYYRVKVRVDDEKNKVTKGSVVHVRGNFQLAVYVDEMKAYTETNREGNLSLNYDFSKKNSEKELPASVEIKAGDFIASGPPPKVETAEQSKKARLNIFVPTVAAKLLIDGKLTDTTGQNREMEFEFEKNEKEKIVSVEVEYTDAEGVLTNKKKKIALKPGQKETIRFTDTYYPKK